MELDIPTPGNTSPPKCRTYQLLYYRQQAQFYYKSRMCVSSTTIGRVVRSVLVQPSGSIPFIFPPLCTNRFFSVLKVRTSESEK